MQEFQRLAEDRARAFDELQAQLVELNAAQDSLTLSSGQNEDWGGSPRGAPLPGNVHAPAGGREREDDRGTQYSA